MKQKYLIIHCAASYDYKPLDKDWFARVHQGARDLSNGKVRYQGKTYENRAALPAGRIGGTLIRTSNGRGWDRDGYTAFYNPDGYGILLTPHNEDEFIDSDEMTWGVAGKNNCSRHLCLVGGYGSSADDNFFDHYTTAVYNSLIYEIAYYRKFFPEVEIRGHNEFDNKACPAFRVQPFLKENEKVIEKIMKKCKLGIHSYR